MAQAQRGLAETIAEMLAEKLSDAERDMLEQSGRAVSQEEGIARDRAVAQAVFARALAGDVAAAKFIAESSARAQPERRETAQPFKLTLTVKKPKGQ